MRRAETAGTAVMVGTEEETEAEEREVEVASRVEMAEVIQVPRHSLCSRCQWDRKHTVIQVLRHHRSHQLSTRMSLCTFPATGVL